MSHTRPPPSSIRVVQVTGALLFVIALAVGGYAYVRHYDAVAPAATAPWLPLTWNVAVFSLFALHHSLLARTRIKSWLHARVGPDAERSSYVIVASVLFLVCTLSWQPLPGTWYVLEGAGRWVGVGVQGAGLLVTLIAARALNIRELMGLSAPRRIVAAHDQPPALETRGLYGLVRHPIYLGWILLVGGAPVMTSTRLLFAAVSVTYLVVAIPLEERSLVEHFGPAYRAYQQRVRWRVVPGLY